MEINRSTWAQLQQAEQEYLQQMADLTTQQQEYQQQQLVQLAIKEELVNEFGIANVPEFFSTIDPDLDVNVTSSTSTASSDIVQSKESNPNQSSSSSTKRTITKTSSSNRKLATTATEKELLMGLQNVQKQRMECELDLIQSVVRAVGPTHAAAVQAAILGNGGSIRSATTTAASALSNDRRPLTSLLQPPQSTSSSSTSNTTTRRRLWMTQLPGDATSSQVSNLREEVTAILRVAHPTTDEVLIVLQTGCGTVTGYGLAAAQLLRLKQAGLYTTICVEQVAASGGYMMACIADTIIASPFAVLSSIGVISDIPNFYERLKQEGIEFQTVIAGKVTRE